MFQSEHFVPAMLHASTVHTILLTETTNWG